MARANVYLPDDLHERARRAELNVSELTQRAIEAELLRRERLAAMDDFLDELERETGVATTTETSEARDWAASVVDIAKRSARGDKPRTRSRSTSKSKAKAT